MPRAGWAAGHRVVLRRLQRVGSGHGPEDRRGSGPPVGSPAGEFRASNTLLHNPRSRVLRVSRKLELQED
jgi:hypothetical protein